MATKPSRSIFRAAERRHRRWMTLLAISATICQARAQYIDLWEAQQQAERSPWLPAPKFVNTDVEVERNIYTSTPGTAQQRFQRLYVAPSVGISWDYYIYHPYLLNYSAVFEPGYIIHYEGPPGNLQRMNELMLDGNFIANILQLKPYATTVNYNHYYGEVNYDIFN